MRELDTLRRSQVELQLKANDRAMQRNGAAGVALIVMIIAFFLYRRRVESVLIAESLSMTDSLTGLRNRRYVQQTIEMDVAASLRRARAALVRAAAVDDVDLIFFMLDLDRFKEINDEYGHAAGDQLLVQVGSVLRATCRDSDVVVRWGGDEFLIVARFTDRNISAITAERLRTAVERHVTTLTGGREIRTTCSIGFAAFPFDLQEPTATSWNEVVAMADQASYSAKRNGRNAWAAADSSDVRSPSAS
jgi:diguanylate cyclase (GGDEF)-like protein